MGICVIQCVTHLSGQVDVYPDSLFSDQQTSNPASKSFIVDNM